MSKKSFFTKKKIIAIIVALILIVGTVVGLLVANNIRKSAREEKFIGTWIVSANSKEEVLIREKGKCIIPYAETCKWEADKDDENVVQIVMSGNDKDLTMTGEYSENGDYKFLTLYGINGKEKFRKK